MRARWLIVLVLIPGCTLLVDAVGDEGGTGGAGAGSATAGAAGMAGAPSGTGAGSDCLPTGAEVCFNGEDDDCNGSADCADAACGGSCEERPEGAVLVKEVATSGACPEGFTERTFADCSGCTCQPGEPGTCLFAVSIFDTTECLGAPLATLTSSASGCVALAPEVTASSGKLGAEIVTVGAGDGTCSVSSPTAAATARFFCEAPASATGCDDLACLPPLVGPTCALFAGDVDCPAAYPLRERLFDGTATSCSCSCSSVDQICPSGQHIHAHPDAACSEGKEDVDADAGCRNTKLETLGGIEQHDAPLPATSTGCANTSIPTGTTPHTLCCAPDA